MDAVSASGLYRLTDAIPGVLDAGSSVLHMNDNPMSAAQIGVRLDSDIVQMRRKTGGLWQSWLEIYTAARVVGGVSQSGGTPTGAVIERGSNANGQYVRYADGTQICTVSGLGTSDSTDTTWTFPASFTFPGHPDRPVLAGNVGTTVGQGYYLIFGGLASPASSIAFSALSGPGTRVAATASLIAIGRWF